jgi:hypothetical protein
MSDSWIKPYEESLPSETIIMPVEGYRLWYVPIEAPTLHSYWIITPWVPGVKMEAECKNHMSCVCAEDAMWTPVKREWEGLAECRCAAGIYAMKTFDQGFALYREEIEKLLSLDAPEPVVNRIVFGKVYLWGKVVECTKGFRGQYAYPSGLYYTAENSPSLANLYRVSLLAFRDKHHDHIRGV